LSDFPAKLFSINNGEVSLRMRRILLAVTCILLLVPTALILAGCGSDSRRVSSPAGALLGSWKPADPNGAAIFFTATTATYVPTSGGKSIAVPYQVMDEDESSVEIKYIGSDAGSNDADNIFRITFSKDWKRFYLYPASAPEVLEYIYVNDREQP
jgi:hypothetical protein